MDISLDSFLKTRGQIISWHRITNLYRLQRTCSNSHQLKIRLEIFVDNLVKSRGFSKWELPDLTDQNCYCSLMLGMSLASHKDQSSLGAPGISVPATPAPSRGRDGSRAMLQWRGHPKIPPVPAAAARAPQSHWHNDSLVGASNSTECAEHRARFPALQPD